MNYRQIIIRAVTFLGGIYLFLEFFLPEHIGSYTWGLYHEQISDGLTLIGAMAFGLGLINLFMIHGTKLAYLRKGWSNSVALLIGVLVMMVVTALEWRSSDQIVDKVEQVSLLRDFAIAIDAQKLDQGKPPVAERQLILVAAIRQQVEAAQSDLAKASGSVPQDMRIQNALEALGSSIRSVQEIVIPSDSAAHALGIERNAELASALGQLGAAWRQTLALQYESARIRKIYQLLFDGLFTALGSAMFALLGFYIATAAYRAFRIRSVESALMMGAALLVMLGQIPFGIWIWEALPDVRLWLLATPSAAARRAIELGASVAGLIMAFRMWLSIESDSFSDRGGKS